ANDVIEDTGIVGLEDYETPIPLQAHVFKNAKPWMNLGLRWAAAVFSPMKLWPIEALSEIADIQRNSPAAFHAIATANDAGSQRRISRLKEAFHEAYLAERISFTKRSGKTAPVWKDLASEALRLGDRKVVKEKALRSVEKAIRRACKRQGSTN